MFIFSLLNLIGGSGENPKECWKVFLDEPKMPKCMIEK